jgi:hypothetical protein
MGKKETIKKAIKAAIARKGVKARENHEVKTTAMMLRDICESYLAENMSEDVLILASKLCVEKMMLFSSKTTFELLRNVGLI